MSSDDARIVTQGVIRLLREKRDQAHRLLEQAAEACEHQSFSKQDILRLFIEPALVITAEPAAPGSLSAKPAPTEVT